MYFRQSIVGLIILSLSVLPPPVLATLPVFDYSNFSQNVMIAARELQSNLNQAKELYNQAMQLENDAKNLARLPVDYWNRIQTNYEQLKSLAQGNASIGQYLQQVDSQFNTLYPGDKAIQNYGDAYKAWTENALKTAQSVINTANEQRKLFDSTASQTQGNAMQGANAQGAVQAVQSQVALSSQMVNELQKLQQMQSEESALQAAYIAGQVQDNSNERRKVQEWLNRPFKPIL